MKPTSLPQGLFVMSSREPMDKEYMLIGMAFLSDAILLGDEGLRAYVQSHPEADVRRFEEGRFILIEDQGVVATVKTDALAQDTVFYFVDDGASTPYWAVSNSLLALTEHIVADGFNPEFDQAGVLNFFAGNQSLWGGQPLSLQTLVRGIRFVPAGHHLELTRGSRPSLQAVTSPESSAPLDYTEGLIQYVNVMRQRIAALIDAGYCFNLGLSGGIDSRMNLALMLPFLNRDAVRVHSNKNRLEDFEVVQQIQAHYGFKIQGFASKLARDPGNIVYCAWKYSTLGVYLPIRVPLRSSYFSKVFNVHGGNFRAGIYHVQPLFKRAKSLTRNINSKVRSQIVQKEFLGFFKEIGIDADDPIALDYHYINTRARFHYGLNWFRQLDQPLFTPHLSKALFNIYHQLESWQQNGEQLIYDVLQLTDPALINFPFDSPSKGFSNEVKIHAAYLEPIRCRDQRQVVTVFGHLPVDLERDEDHSDAADIFESLLEEDLKASMAQLHGQDVLIDDAIDELALHKANGGSAIKHRYTSLIIALAHFSKVLNTQKVL